MHEENSLELGGTALRSVAPAILGPAFPGSRGQGLGLPGLYPRTAKVASQQHPYRSFTADLGCSDRLAFQKKRPSPAGRPFIISAGILTAPRTVRHAPPAGETAGHCGRTGLSPVGSSPHSASPAAASSVSRSRRRRAARLRVWPSYSSRLMLRDGSSSASRRANTSPAAQGLSGGHFRQKTDAQARAGPDPAPARSVRLHGRGKVHAPRLAHALQEFEGEAALLVTDEGVPHHFIPGARPCRAAARRPTKPRRRPAAGTGASPSGPGNRRRARRPRQNRWPRT